MLVLEMGGGVEEYMKHATEMAWASMIHQVS
jgi:hypothetical protein